MSRTFDQYSPIEQVNVLRQKISGDEKYSDELHTEGYVLQVMFCTLQQAIDKLPKEEKNLTYKRYNKMWKIFLKEIDNEDINIISQRIHRQIQ